MDRLKGKRALITGGTTGIGLATARQFLLEGARVMATGLNEETLSRARQELGSDVAVVKLDAGNAADQQRLRSRVEAEFGQLDVAVGKAEDNAMSHYNIGLVYYQLGEYDKAVTQARKAKELGVDHKQLETLLRKAGQWKDQAN